MRGGAAPAVSLSWRPERLQASAEQLERLADDTRAATGRLDSSVRGALASVRWAGPAAAAARASVDRRLVVLQRTGLDLAAAAGRLLAASRRLPACQDRLSECLEAVRQHPLLRADAQGEVSVDWARAAPAALLGGLPADTAVAEAGVLAHVLNDRLRSALAEAAAIDGESAAALDELAAASRASMQADEPGLLRAGLAAEFGVARFERWLREVPSAETAPEAVAQWWAAHTQAEQVALAGRGDLGAALGSLDGVPPAVRDLVNRRELRRRLSGYAAARGELEREIAEADSEGQTELLRQRDALVAAQVVDERTADQLRTAAGWLDPQTRAPVGCQLLVDEPYRWGGRGRVSIGLGRVDAARHVAYLVPGLDETVRSSLPGLASAARHLYDSARSAAPRSTVAVVAWLGYQTPGLAEVAFDRRAREGGALLARDLRGLRASRELDQPHVTVVGHSYGSTTAAAAVALAREAADDIAFLGSPGVLADRAAQVAVPAGHVWVGAASADEVSRLSRFGTDPAAASFGARRFAAEAAPGTSLLRQHLRYFDEGSESARSLGRIIVGAGSSVAQVPGRTDHGLVGLLAPALAEALEPQLEPFAPGRQLDPTFGDPARGRSG